VTPEQEKQLKEALELARENNQILRKMRRSMIWNRIFKFFYLLVILAVTFGAYYFIQPYLDGALGAYQNVVGTSQKVQQTGSNLPDVLNFLQMLGISL
jgi:hypothetical protein